MNTPDPAWQFVPWRSPFRYETRPGLSPSRYQCHRPFSSWLTTAPSGHSPRLSWTMQRAASRAIVFADSLSAPPTCGATTTLSSWKSGLSAVGRLLLEHVQAGAAQVAGLEGGHQVGLDHDAAPGRVDEDAARLHRREHPGVEQPARLGVQRAVEAEVVAAGQQRVEFHQLDAVLPDEALDPGTSPWRGASCRTRRPGRRCCVRSGPGPPDPASCPEAAPSA